MKLKKITASLIVSGAVLSSPLIVNAQTTTTPVDQLEDEMAKLTDVYDEVVPVAIGATAFSIGMILIKRIAFS